MGTLFFNETRLDTGIEHVLRNQKITQNRKKCVYSYMPAIFRTDSGIFGDIQASNMIVTGEIKVGETQQPINTYITQEIKTVVGGGVDYSEEIISLSGQISGVSGYTTGLSGIVNNATGDINSLSGVVSGILENPTSSEGVSNEAFSGLSGYTTGLAHTVGLATGDINSLSGQITGITGDVGEISGFLNDLDTSAHYSDTDVETYLDGNLNADIIPATNSTYDIGSAEKKIRHLYLSSNSLYIGGKEGVTGTAISATPEGGIVLSSELNVSGINISGAIGGVTPNAENNSIQWNTGTKQWESNNSLHTATGDLYSFYKKEVNTISNVSGNFNALNFQPTNIPTTKISAGTKGEITYDENYVYLCVADNVWKRLPSADF